MLFSVLGLFLKYLLPVKVDPTAGFHLDVEDYLFGLLQLANELSRFSINAVVVGNSVLPFKVNFLHIFFIVNKMKLIVCWLESLISIIIR